MKNVRLLLLVLGLLAVMGLGLLAEEPQGGGAQGPPAPVAGARGDQAPGPGGPPGGFGGGGRGGGGGKNVQVLGAAPIPETMQSFVQALGLLDKGTCDYCHVQDKASDEKRPKQVARRMITMMRAINGTFPDGQPHVTCYTCHRGNTKPLTAPEL
ncbi:MAG TPA: photosynthetic reaction center cytochrome c subunit family protein [Vicinamibacterales bacterium]|nr:photosynthetic reaction center cytochrome c subunit family protein [Vicinamibacterales bacterium]